MLSGHQGYVGDGKQRGRAGEDERKRITEGIQTQPAATRSSAPLNPGVWKYFRNEKLKNESKTERREERWN